MPIKISGPIIEEHMAYFIMDDNTSKGRDPNVNIISGIPKIKGRTSVNILVSNYTNKHLTFHKGENIGHLEPAVIADSTIEQRETHQTNSLMRPKPYKPNHKASSKPSRNAGLSPAQHYTFCLYLICSKRIIIYKTV